ncbi:hypothetical protein [Legionella jamestowniensis]|uniref:Gala protein type 1, 3 or 4 n=1 Tax=Legionella jamestowniensis TaxID=455 RepID=A0A0W0UH18_9GAMM|nr:hypothetical protein [Legionella jamestowniensis]KTD06934.1 Gala protein type 1, 3 or 4 [Legionella jamestowniensis]SFL84891.1 Leucine Rich repeat-containing protein [Legionella jamestowniensis DSM 19215]
MSLTLERIKVRVSGNRLDLQRLSINDDDVPLICDFLKENPQITTLNLCFNNIGVAGAQLLARNHTITSLDVSFNQLGDEGAQALAMNQTITSLYIAKNNLGASGARYLANNQIITSLSVACNKIGTGVQYFADNKTITSLSIADNEIGDKDIKALTANNTITTLNASFNRIGDKGAQALASNKTITSLVVSHNRIGRNGAQALACNETITCLDIYDNNIGLGAIALANSRTLTKFRLDINPEISQSLLDALINNTTLVEFDVRCNEEYIDDKFLDTIAKICNRNKLKIPAINSLSLARLFLQAQRSWNQATKGNEENNICYLGRLPNEMVETIASHALNNYNATTYRFFADYAAAREKGDLELLKQQLSNSKDTETIPYSPNDRKYVVMGS